VFYYQNANFQKNLILFREVLHKIGHNERKGNEVHMMKLNNQGGDNLEIFDFECECGNQESYYLDPATYELKMIECKNCQSVMHL
jgi:hypothetical protein